MSNEQTVAVVIYQLCFAEERRLTERLENAKAAFLRHQGELETGCFFKALNELGYYRVIAEKIFDILSALEYNDR